jgi:NAD+ kinase
MKVALFGRFYKTDDKPYLEELILSFEKYKINFIIFKPYFDSFRNEISISNVQTFESDQALDKSVDYFIALGGDGTILRAATLIKDKNIPVLGINMGRLGFLANVSKNDIEKAVEMMVKKEFLIRERLLISVSTSPEVKELASLNFALNEVTLSRNNTASMISVNTYLDGEFLTSYWADGLIMTTPTGSTGYSLSCGGPVIDPNARSFALTPIAPHNLSARPMVIHEDTEVSMQVKSREDSYLLALDTRIMEVPIQTKITVKKADFTIRMISLNGQTFFKTLREKLFWGQDHRN